jgi:pimeloyl-ACP methyl ester carboxylesterase
LVIVEGGVFMKSIYRRCSVTRAAFALFLIYSSGCGGHEQDVVASREHAVTTAIADAVFTFTPSDRESCSAPTVFQDSVLQDQTGRLRNSSLRQAARRANARHSLVMATVHLARGNSRLGRAFADLSVTGRRAYANFLRDRRTFTADSLARQASTNSLARSQPMWRLRTAANQAIDRAYRVLHALNFGMATPRRFRSSLGYIAVSSEDDLPRRPVNNPASAEYQRDLTVTVNGIRVQTRYIVAGPTPADAVAYRPSVAHWPPAYSRLPEDARVLVFIHGMDSRLEEATDLIDAVRRQFPGQPWYVISMDLPTQGYATQIDHRAVSRLSAVGHPKNVIGFEANSRQNVPVLDFTESFVLSVINTLDGGLGLRDKVWAVVGGSLGGNLTFRLGRRNIPWIRNVVSWSPGSIWDSFADDVLKENALRITWYRAGGSSEHVTEASAQRAKFFDMAFNPETIAGIPLSEAQDAQWWGDSFPCKQSFRRAARAERFEFYSQRFRLWHWRVALEQMLYSHNRTPRRSSPRYMANRTPMLLLAGEQDNFANVEIYNNTRRAALNMSRTIGRALFLRRTGHSIHNERPNFLARQIVSFLTSNDIDRRVISTMTFDRVTIRGRTRLDDVRSGSRAWVGVRLASGAVIEREVTTQVNRGPNRSFRVTLDLGRRMRTADLRGLQIRHRSGSCFGCGRDYWDLRADLSANGRTLARSGELRIGNQTRTFVIDTP